jgi:hypothetical protein
MGTIARIRRHAVFSIMYLSLSQPTNIINPYIIDKPCGEFFVYFVTKDV